MFTLGAEIIILVILFAPGLSPFEHDFSKQAFSQEVKVITYDLMPLSKYDLVHDSELVILGNVIEQNSAGTVGEEQAGVPKNVTDVPAIQTTLGVEKVIKGDYDGNKIDIITEGDLSGKITFEGPAKFHKGEKTILFLYREKGYDGKYAAMGMEQGKYQIDSNGLVEGKLMVGAGYDSEYWPLNKTSIEDFETEIKNILTQPKPKPITEDLAPYDRDLTTEEVKELERNTTGDFVVK